MLFVERPLSERATINWTRQHLGTDADEEFCRACHSATGGNPLFLRELLRTLDAQGIELELHSLGRAGPCDQLGVVTSKVGKPLPRGNLPSPEPVRFDTVLELGKGAYEVKGEDGAQ